MRITIIRNPYILFFFLSLTLISCKKLEAPVYVSTENIEVKERSKTSVTLIAEVNFFNPNDYRITLKQADIDVLLNDKPLTSFKKDYNLKIEKKASFTVPVELTFSVADLNTNVISSAISALMGKKQTLTYQGTIKFRAFGLRIRVPVYGDTDFDLSDL